MGYRYTWEKIKKNLELMVLNTKTPTIPLRFRGCRAVWPYSFTPVGHDIGCKVHAVFFKGSGLALYRERIDILSVEYAGNERSRGDAVSEQINTVRCSDDSAGVVLGSINMDMVFVYDECLRYDMKALVSLIGKLLVTVRELLSELFIRKGMVYDAGRKFFKVSVTFARDFLPAV